MADDPRARMLLIVTGSMLRAEAADRPLAYYLKQQIERLLSDHGPDATRFDVRVIADFRWLHDEPLQVLPTISLGGPGVNAVAQRWLEELPLSLAVDEQYYIQMDPELDEPRVSIWGMDNANTQIAVSAFVQRYLARFLDHCTSLPDLDDPETEPDSDPDEDEDED
jgi:hypothetical protein